MSCAAGWRVERQHLFWAFKCSCRCARRLIEGGRPACKSERPLACCQLAADGKTAKRKGRGHGLWTPLGPRDPAGCSRIARIMRQLPLKAILFQWSGRSAGYPWQARPCAQGVGALHPAHGKARLASSPHGTTFFTQRPAPRRPCGGGAVYSIARSSGAAARSSGAARRRELADDSVRALRPH